MYIWNIKTLKNSLKEQPLSEKESLKYLVVFVFFYSLLCALPHNFDNIWDGISYLSFVPIAVFGAIYLFSKNGGKNGRYFLQRYLSISWVVGVRLLLICLIPVILLVLISEKIILGHVSEKCTIYEAIIIFIFDIFLYWRIGYHINDVAIHYEEKLKL